MAASFSTERREALVAGRRLSFVEAGAGDALVLLHGVGSSALSWRAQLADLASDFRVLAWDAPGYGGSQPFDEETADASAYADVLRDLLDARGVETCHLVGHSLGCLVAARFAVEAPRRVKTLTLASCAIGHARLPAQERERLFAARVGDLETLGARGMAEKRGPRLLGPHASPDHVRAVVDVMARVSLRGYGQAARLLSGGDLLADIAALPADLPVQFVWGDADVITPPAVNESAAAVRPEAPRTTIAGAGHACYVERAEEFDAIIRAFARTHAGRGRD